MKVITNDGFTGTLARMLSTPTDNVGSTSPAAAPPPSGVCGGLSSSLKTHVGEASIQRSSANPPSEPIGALQLSGVVSNTNDPYLVSDGMGWEPIMHTDAAPLSKGSLAPPLGAGAARLSALPLCRSWYVGKQAKSKRKLRLAEPKLPSHG